MMCVSKLLTSVNLISLLSVALCDQQLSFAVLPNDVPSDHLVRVPLLKNQIVTNNGILAIPDSTTEVDKAITSSLMEVKNRVRREFSSEESDEGSDKESGEDQTSFQRDEVGWSNINEEVDFVIPMVLAHLQKLNIEHLQLPDMKETITVSPLFITYEAGLFLTNGIVYNIEGIERYGDAYMTYEGKSFLSRFNIILKSLQFEYNFLLKFMALEGSGKIVGSLDNTIVYAELAVNVANISLKLNDFRIMKFSNINVQLDQMRIIRQLTGAILSPITNLFKDRITTSISDGLKEQMQTIMDDFNNNDPLELQKFTKKLIAGLTGQTDLL